MAENDIPAAAAAFHDVGAVSTKDDEDSMYRDEEDLSRLLGRDDPDRMKLTKQEHDQAWTIKKRVEAIPDLDDLSDLMYVQLALVCKEDVEDAVTKCYAMQEFRQEYKIVETLPQGSHYLDWGFKMFPRFFLSFFFSEEEGTFVFVHDVEKLDPKQFTTSEMADDWMRHQYYGFRTFFPDVESIRKGIVLVAECQGMTMRRDVLRHNSRFFSEFLAHFPFTGVSRSFHTSAMFNCAVSILRKLVPEELGRSFQVGFQFEGHLGDVYLTPNLQEANQKMLARMKDNLRLRLENEKLKLLEY